MSLLRLFLLVSAASLYAECLKTDIEEPSATSLEEGWMDKKDFLKPERNQKIEPIIVESSARSPKAEWADKQGFFELDRNQKLNRMTDTFLDPKLWQFLAVPVTCAMAGGMLRLCSVGVGSVGDFLLYFGVQASLGFYMKIILSKTVVLKDSGLVGLPAPLAVTGLQQLVSFALLMVCLACSRLTPWSYKPKPIKNYKQRFMVLGLAACFAANIGLNNLSLSYLDVSVNMAIRSTTPMVGMMVDAALAPLVSYMTGRDDLFGAPMLVEALAVLCGTIFSVGMIFSKGSGGHVTQDIFGMAVCFASVVISYVELLFVKFMSTEVKLNPVDAIWHMALPVAGILTPFVFIFSHAVPWSGNSYMTDYEVLKTVYALNPWTLILALASGILALAFNLVFYNVVQKFSPITACVASNFNKVATVILSLLVGLEPLPLQYWKYVLFFCAVGNGTSFALIGLAKQHVSEAMRNQAASKTLAFRETKQ